MKKTLYLRKIDVSIRLIIKSSMSYIVDLSKENRRVKKLQKEIKN
jgi:hypothetical protein